MHLTSIAIKGFKSFAKKTELEFEPGITMIVGPNGSGKSNVTDAIQWVLGEQSPSALRGSAMQDVIFAGSLNHKALGLSEVTLTLDNSDKSLNLDFSEVTITRRLLRNGENSYFINSTACRLLDIYDLLHDTSLGRQTHSIIGQGKLEGVVNSKPEEKRVLLEEAAGVLKHKKRKERALKKLVSTEENINRAKDILKEVSQQIKPLEQQVVKAKTYNQLSKELKNLEIATLVKKIANVKGRWQDITNKEIDISNNLKPLEKQLNDLSQDITAQEEKYQKQASLIAQQQKLKEKLTNQHQNLERLLSVNKHRGQSIQANNLELKEQLDHLDTQMNIKQAQINNLSQQLENIKNEINRNLKAIQGKRKESEDLVPSHQQLENDLEKQQEQLDKLENSLKELQQQKLEKINSLSFLQKEHAKHVLEKLEAALTSIEQAIASSKSKKEKTKEFLWQLLNQTLSQQKQTLESIKKIIQTSQLTTAKLEDQKKLANESDAKIKEKLALGKSIATLKDLLHNATNEKQVFQLALTELNYQSKNLTHQQLALGKQCREVKNELEQLSKQRQKYLQKFSSNENSLVLISKFTSAGQQLAECLKKRVDEFSTEQLNADSISAIRSLREQEKELNQKIKDLESRKQQFDVDKGVLKSTIDGLAERIIQDYNLAIETAIEKYGHLIPDRERISYIKQQLSDIGPVNAIAEEQYKTLSERKDFLEGQIADLLSSKTSITKIIRAIDKKIKEKLLTAFEEISINFKQMFGRLFPGGQAELILTGDDIFESGLEIKAQPYGKSPKKLSLLSGGETALTALALLFAVYYTRPSPFYVLDEVEAALDDINLQRFIRLLKEMKMKTQFIVITHQRRTMEVADCLYGITMQADGISKVVSQKMGKENQEVVVEVSVS